MAAVCPPNTELPDIGNLPIPKDLNVYVQPGTNVSVPGLVTCCSPNKVQLANTCYVWCQIPDTFFNGTKSSSTLTDGFDKCLFDNNAARNRSISGYRIASGATKAVPSIQALCIILLVVAFI